MAGARAMHDGAPGDPEAFARRHGRQNVLALGADFALFMVGLSLAPQSTILPAFAEHPGASNLMIGAIPAVMTLGWLLPSLFASGHTETLRLKLRPALDDLGASAVPVAGPHGVRPGRAGAGFTLLALVVLAALVRDPRDTASSGAW
jgi:hypothetical protein